MRFCDELCFDWAKRRQALDSTPQSLSYTMAPLCVAVFLSILATFVCAQNSTNVITAASPLVQWQGRYNANSDDGSVSFDWEGTQASFAVSGAGIYVRAIMNVSVAAAGRVSVFVNGYNTGNMLVHSSTSTYLIAAGLQGTVVHNITLHYTMEPVNAGSGVGADVRIYGFESSGTFTSPPTPMARRMDIIGDSITAGSQWDRENHLCGDWVISNSQAYNWESYLCRNFTANCTTTAWSGRGLVWNCVGPATLPTLYLQTEGGTPLGSTPNAAWDFSRASRPDAVLINLGQNDFGCGPGGPNLNATMVQLWQDTYLAFLTNITQYYANSRVTAYGAEHSSQGIVFFLGAGPMSTYYTNATQGAVVRARAERGLHAVFLDLGGATLDGCGGHPGAYGHWDMFSKAQPQIAAVMGW